MKRVALLFVLLLAACTADPADTPVASPKPSAGEPGAACASQITDGKKVAFGPDNVLAGVVLGNRSNRGMVLVHELSANLCQWIPEARELVARGYQVLAFDMTGFGVSVRVPNARHNDVVEAAKLLRSMGSSSITLMGASMGGGVVMFAASEIEPPVAAVISVSGASSFAVDRNVTTYFDKGKVFGDIGKLQMPILYITAELDTRFTEEAKLMHEASKESRDARLYIIKNGAGHGVSLVSPKGGDEGARKELADFLERNVE